MAGQNNRNSLHYNIIWNWYITFETSKDNIKLSEFSQAQENFDNVNFSKGVFIAGLSYYIASYCEAFLLFCAPQYSVDS